jgi:hypothetical protein
VSAVEHFFSLRLGIFEVRFFNDSQSKGTASLLQNEVATRLYRSRIFLFFYGEPRVIGLRIFNIQVKKLARNK